MAWWGTGRLSPDPHGYSLPAPCPPLGPSTPPGWGPLGAGGGRWQWWCSQGAFPGTHAHLHADGGRGRNSNGVGGCLGPGLPPPLLARSNAPYRALLTTAVPCPPKPTLRVPGGAGALPLGGGRHPLHSPSAHPTLLRCLQEIQPLPIPILPRDPHLGQAPQPRNRPPSMAHVPSRLVPVPVLSPTRSLGSWARTAKVVSWRHWHLVCAGRVSRVWQLSVSQFPKPASLINGMRARESNLK